jgi:hypothetical protein
MVIRFPSRKKEDRQVTHPRGPNRTGARALTPREIEHRARMLNHLARRTPGTLGTLEPLEP